MESALWAAIRALEESATVSRRMAQASTGGLRERFEDRARSMSSHADTLRTIVTGGSLAMRGDLVERG